MNPGASYADTDPFATALSKAETVGAQITSWVAHPQTLLDLSKLKIGTGWNLPLLGADPTSPTKRSILGVPIYWSPAVDQGCVWGIPKAKVFVVIRSGTSVVADSSAFFSSDRVSIRCTMRVAYAFPHAQALIRIGAGGS